MEFLRTKKAVYIQVLLFYYSFVYLSVFSPARAYAGDPMQHLWSTNVQLPPLYLILNQKALSLCRIALTDEAGDKIYPGIGNLVERNNVTTCVVQTGITLSFRSQKNATMMSTYLQTRLNPLGAMVGDAWLHAMESEDYEIVTLPEGESIGDYQSLSAGNVSALVNAGNQFQLPEASGVDGYSIARFDYLTGNKRDFTTLSDPVRFYQCMANYSDCPGVNNTGYSDIICPAGTFLNYNPASANNCYGLAANYPCLACDNSYRYAFIPAQDDPASNPAFDCECQKPTTCTGSFTEVQPYTAQHDRVCGCDEGTRFIYTLPTNVTKDFTFDGNSVQKVDAQPPYKAFYEYYDFACMPNEKPCLAEAADGEIVSGVSFASENYTSCHFLTPVNGSDWKAGVASALSITTRYLASHLPTFSSQYLGTTTAASVFSGMYSFMEDLGSITPSHSQSQGVPVSATSATDSSRYTTNILTSSGSYSVSTSYPVDFPATTPPSFSARVLPVFIVVGGVVVTVSVVIMVSSVIMVAYNRKKYRAALNAARASGVSQIRQIGSQLQRIEVGVSDSNPTYGQAKSSAPAKDNTQIIYDEINEAATRVTIQKAASSNSIGSYESMGPYQSMTGTTAHIPSIYDVVNPNKQRYIPKYHDATD